MNRFDFDFARILGKPATSEKANNDCLLKGRITRPPVALTDPAFEYTSSVHTDLGETFRRAKEARNQ